MVHGKWIILLFIWCQLKWDSTNQFWTGFRNGDILPSVKRPNNRVLQCSIWNEYQFLSLCIFVSHSRISSSFICLCFISLSIFLTIWRHFWANGLRFPKWAVMRNLCFSCSFQSSCWLACFEYFKCAGWRWEVPKYVICSHHRFHVKPSDWICAPTNDKYFQFCLRKRFFYLGGIRSLFQCEIGFVLKTVSAMERTSVCLREFLKSLNVFLITRTISKKSNLFV